MDSEDAAHGPGNMTEILTLMCVECGSSVEVAIDPDNMDEWYELAVICRRLQVQHGRIAVPLLRQIMEPVGRN